ncbi:MFS transporter [Pandoraea thiooxydans]|uniref:Putative tartrate transporter n=1 Tax=Pandoraea thiooxydans TaxID=445709 RepID=A0A0G3ER52_9BURK|nr:MFS transporter [Pandoraea thiooxydans]AKJ67186.1 MFS transporter [Pandoraea thiooxydans]APR94157.1 MFS transporter [Pandoraea thiooxydans]
MESVTSQPNTATSGTPSAFEVATYRKVGWRLIPLLLICYVVSYLDRVNVGFAKLQMVSDLKFSETVYGLGAGIFFFGYFLFEVPSNIILHKVGARVWIARIMITWGIVSGATMFVSTPETFYVMRFLLGLAEAGFFPGIILYLTYWYPSARRGRMTAWFMTAVALSGFVGGPLSGWILKDVSGLYGLAGWQWLFLLEALPSLVIGVVVFFYLDDRIQSAKWLTDEEKALLVRNIDTDAVGKHDLPLSRVFGNGRLWVMSLIYFSFVIGLYGVSFWLPTIIKSTGVKDPLTIGLLTAIPFGFAVIAMLVIGWRSDLKRERRWHVAIPALISAAGLFLSTVWSHNTQLAMIALTFATMGIMAVLPLFWSLPTAILGGAAAAAGIAMINSLGNLAGFFGPYLVGFLKDATHSTNSGIYVLAAFMVLGALLVLSMPARLVDK